jgi:Sap, sulfolipid-1-addressing protein
VPSEAFLVALIITIEPLPIIAFILILSAEHGVKKGLAYIVGWVLCLFMLIIVTVNFTEDRTTSHRNYLPAWATTATAFVVGVLAIAFAVHRHRHPKEPSSATPKWASRLDTMPLWIAALFGVLMQPWPFVVAGSAKIAAQNYERVHQVIALLIFGVISTSTLLAMEIYSVASPNRSRVRLDGIHTWIDTHRQGVITGLLSVIGVWLIVQSVYSILISFG